MERGKASPYRPATCDRGNDRGDLAGSREFQTGDDHLVRLVAGIKAAAPDRTLQQIAAQLESMHERTPRGGTRWHPSSVKHLLGTAERIGLVGANPVLGN